MDVIRRAPIGRPRGFDTEEALGRAMLIFWERGYDAVSLADLARAMGITKTSLYAAFGNKEDLFRKALERYADGPASYGAHAVTRPTAREVAAAYLTGAVEASTQPGCPAGCLGVLGLLAADHLGPTVRDGLVAWRDENRSRLRDRFQHAVDTGDLPPDADPELLARYLMTMANGIGVQAASGASRDQLQQMVDAAVRNWPPV